MNQQINNLIRPYVDRYSNVGYKHNLSLAGLLWNYRCIYCSSRFQGFLDVHLNKGLNDNAFYGKLQPATTLKIYNKPFYL